MKTDASLHHLGSLRHTLAGLGLLAAVALLRPTAPWLGAVATLLALNLGAALCVHPRLRRQLPLLVAHAAMLALPLLVAGSRLVALDGRFELTQGVPFDGRLLDVRDGPLHVAPLHRLALRHDGFEIDYAPGRQRGATRNAVTWVGTDGQPRSAVIGDHRPLLLDGFRIYTSPNKGYAPVLRWQPAQGPEQTGALHLPSYPMHELRQSNEWRLPDGRLLWVQLQIDDTPIDPARADRFRLPARQHLVLRLGDERVELAPGAAADLGGGRLVYEELRTWMGYRVAYDPTLPWLLAAALLATAALALHYVLKFSAAAPAPQAALGVVDG